MGEKLTISKNNISFEAFYSYNLLLLIIVFQGLIGAFEIETQFETISFFIINVIGVLFPGFIILKTRQCKFIDKNMKYDINNICLIYEYEKRINANLLSIFYSFFWIINGINMILSPYTKFNNQQMFLIFGILYTIFGIFILFNYLFVIKKVDKDNEIQTILFVNRQLIYYGVFFSLMSTINIIYKIRHNNFDKYFYSSIIFLIASIVFTYFVIYELRRISELISLNIDKTNEDELNILFQLKLLLKVVPSQIIFMYLFVVLINGSIM